MAHADDIEKNYDVLLRCTTINCYVIDCLKAENVLDRMQEAELRTKRNSLKQCDLLFKWLKEVSYNKFQSFLQVMNDTEQEHVANLLRGSTEEGNLPLSEARHQRLDKIRPKIANVICIDSEVISELRSCRAISRTDAEDIRAEKVDYAKISKLISVIMRRSNHSYNSFREVLRKTLQTAAAAFLCEGEMPAVHLNSNRSDLDGILSSTFNEAIRNKSGGDTGINELLTEMNGLGLNPVKAIPGQSIVIFIYCKTVHNAVTFMKLFNSGRLQRSLEVIFNRLLLTIEPHNTEKLDSQFSLEDEEDITLEDFTGIEGWMRESFNRSKPIGKICGCDATTQTEEETFMINKTAELRYKSDPVLVRKIRTNTAEKKKKLISGMTILNKELFVVSQMSSEVEVYDSMKFSFSRRWNLKELINPKDIASCNRCKCLYIINFKRSLDEANEILRVDPNGKLIKKWSTGDDYGFGLSVTDESNVILTVYDKNKLNEYSPDGQLIRKINLTDADIRHPWHAIKLTNGHFVVSNGIRRDDLHRVCIVDADGDLVKSFGGKRDSNIGQMNHPVYLAVDDNGFVMVADFNNSRVLLLDSDLKFKREILSKEGNNGLRYPSRILLDKSNGRLFVADNESNNQRILIFDFKQID